MPIIDDYAAIAKRMRELRSANPRGADQITELELWRDATANAVRYYVRKRRLDMALEPVLRRGPMPTD
jgi:hypothetical protein